MVRAGWRGRCQRHGGAAPAPARARKCGCCPHLRPSAPPAWSVMNSSTCLPLKSSCVRAAQGSDGGRRQRRWSMHDSHHAPVHIQTAETGYLAMLGRPGSLGMVPGGWGRLPTHLQRPQRTAPQQARRGAQMPAWLTRRAPASGSRDGCLSTAEGNVWAAPALAGPQEWRCNRYAVSGMRVRRAARPVVNDSARRGRRDRRRKCGGHAQRACVSSGRVSLVVWHRLIDRSGEQMDGSRRAEALTPACHRQLRTNHRPCPSLHACGVPRRAAEPRPTPLWRCTGPSPIAPSITPLHTALSECRVQERRRVKWGLRGGRRRRRCPGWRAAAFPGGRALMPALHVRRTVC